MKVAIKNMNLLRNINKMQRKFDTLGQELLKC